MNKLLTFFLSIVLTLTIKHAAIADEHEKKGIIEAGVEISHIAYREPGLMREEGFMYGINLAYTHHGRAIRKIDAKLSYGSLDYTGSTFSGTPLKINNIDDIMFEMRGTQGRNRGFSESHFIRPYFGLGYRYLFDNTTNYGGGYRRESNYLYLPFGVELVPRTGSSWSFGATLEYNFFLLGRQISRLGDVDPGFNTVRNDQDSGYGIRGSLTFLRRGKSTDLLIEPFFRYWSIDESDVDLLTFNGTPVGYLVEPENESSEIGEIYHFVLTVLIISAAYSPMVKEHQLYAFS